MYGIRYNDKYSCDLGLQVLERNISTPSKKKITEEIPFSNVVYDFSFLYGSQIYEQRKLEYTFFVNELFKDKLEAIRMVVENWLYSSKLKSKLEDDTVRGYYFLAECISIDFEDLKTYGKIQATFEAYPFRLKNELEGEILWDSFCFLTDTLQPTSFNINTSKEIELVNNSIIEIAPEVIADADFKIYKDSSIFYIQKGTSQSEEFKLQIGLNKLTIVGTGNISFNFRTEVI